MEKWTKKRQLFLLELTVFLLCLAVGVVLELSGFGFVFDAVTSFSLVVIMIIHIILRLTYFRKVIPEIRQQRKERESAI